MNGLEILGLGTALPEYSISQTAMATFAATCVVPELTRSNNAPGLIRALPSGLMRTATLTLVLLSIAALIMIFELIYSFDIIFNPPPGKVISGDLYRTKSKDQDAHSLC